MAEHMNEFQGIVNQLTNVSMTIKDESKPYYSLAHYPIDGKLLLSR